MMPRRTTHLVLLLAALAGVHRATAQPAESLLAELEATQRRASDRSVSLREREQAADKAMELRTRAIAAARPDDPRLPAFLMDNAAAELARLGRDGSDTAVLFGIPLPAQADAVRQAASSCLALLDRAAALLDERWKPLESLPPDDPARTQVEQERTVRIPFFASRARVLLAADLPPSQERSRLAQLAFDSVGKLALSNPGPESIRRITIGAALLFRAPPSEPADLQTAIDEFGWILTGHNGGPQPGASAVTRAEAWFGLISAACVLGRFDSIEPEFTRALQREPFVGPDGKADPLLAVLAADVVTRAWVVRAAATGERSALDRAVAAQQSLLRRSDLPLRPDSLRPLVYQKLHLVSALAARRGELDLPPAMDLAAAIDAARDPARRAEALRLLRAVAEAPDSGDFAADALWELAVLNAPGAERLQAVKDLSRLARDFPTLPRATEAMSAALAYAQNLAADSTSTAASSEYRAALQLAVERYPSLPGIDTWRYEYARILADRAAPSIDELRAALNALRQIRPGASVEADANILHARVQSAVLDEAWARFADLRRSIKPVEAAALCRTEILPEARRAVEWATAAASPSLDRFKTDLADAMTETGDSTAQRLYEDLLTRSAPALRPRLRLGHARCLLLAGKTEAAFAVLRDLATSLDAPPASPADPSRPAEFWHAWTLMLEALADRNADGARSASILAHLKRLESIDASLGGEPWRSRLTIVRARLKA
ncbi:MAG: hypothetical protein KF678_04920 [Phycisphaeraceae bacterium]|nr:hypothetical protein [Phycisphaeraceae bacterium]